MRWYRFQIDVGFKDETEIREPDGRQMGQAMVDMFNADAMDRAIFRPAPDNPITKGLKR